jgi:hypothetical protein
MYHVLIYSIANPDDVHPGVADIIPHRSLVLMLLARHFKKHGGLCLPPRADVLSIQYAFRRQREEMRAHHTPQDSLPIMNYPNWYVVSS